MAAGLGGGTEPFDNRGDLSAAEHGRRIAAWRAADMHDPGLQRVHCTAGTRSAAAGDSAPRVGCAVVDRAIQVHGGAGVCQDFPLAQAYAGLRSLRLADGPDEVHLLQLGRMELQDQRKAAAGRAKL